MHVTVEKENIHFLELSSGALSRFAFSLSVALAAISTKSPGYLVLLLLFGMSALVLWGGQFSAIVKIGRYVIPFLIIIFLLHLFSHMGQPLFRIWFLTATSDGVRAGFLYGLKLLIFSFAGGIIFLAVNPFDLIAPLERLAKALGPLGRPIGTLALSFFLAMRFLPELSHQAHLTILALKSRGYDARGGLLQKAKFAALLIAPMFVNGFKRAELAAIALEVKGYATRYSNAIFPPVRIKLGSIITFAISMVILITGWRV